LKVRIRLIAAASLALVFGWATGSALAQSDPVPVANTKISTDTSTAKRWVSIGIGSHHLSNASQYNQNNPGLGIEIPFTNPWMPSIDSRYALGFFRNSERATSTYGGAFFFPWAHDASHIKAGALVGIINGYERANNSGFFPLVVPTLAYEGKGFGANLFLIPPVAGIPATLALQVKVGF
jgi:hypothetical protein